MKDLSSTQIISNFLEFEQSILDICNTNLKSSLLSLDFLSDGDLFIGQFSGQEIQSKPHKVLIYFRYESGDRKTDNEKDTKGTGENKFFLHFELASDFSRGRDEFLKIFWKLKQWIDSEFLCRILKGSVGYAFEDKSFMASQQLEGQINLMNLSMS